MNERLSDLIERAQTWMELADAHGDTGPWSETWAHHGIIRSLSCLRALPLCGESDGDDGYKPGAWDEVRSAHMDGHISAEAYETLRTLLATPAEPARESDGAGLRDVIAARLNIVGPLRRIFGAHSRSEELLDALEVLLAQEVEALADSLASDWLAARVAEAEQVGREDNADHGMCYVSGSKALAAREAAAARDALTDAAEFIEHDLAAMKPITLGDRLALPAAKATMRVVADWLRDRAQQLRAKP